MEWFERSGKFEGRAVGGFNRSGQGQIFDVLEQDQETDKETARVIFQQMAAYKQAYPNYIFALTMGLGKTVLMATCIFYEFLLANKFPQDEKYCHNALVFAPDKTVLTALREIETFDKSRVVPAEHINWLDAHLKFHFLDESGDALNVLDGTAYNVIITNTQKIILKRQNKAKQAADLLFADAKKTYNIKELNKDFEDLYDFDNLDSEAELVTNQRFEKLRRLRNLGIYVDEAHHVFGTKLAQDFDPTQQTSLRATINALAKLLSDRGEKVVACYNFTGTPYVGSRLLPEVVYSYGLKEAIDNKYLKQVKLDAYENVRHQTKAFLKSAISGFWEQFGQERYEGMLPKMAIFCTTVDELKGDIRPSVESILAELNIPTSKVLENTEKSTNDEIREFNLLDTPASEKQFILLVNKGKEGWNCRSLFSVAMHREPKSKVFVLQATMRCLRAIGEVQETAKVYLSKECETILRNELDQNFKLTLEDLTTAGDDDSDRIEVHVVPPPIKVKLQRVQKRFELRTKQVERPRISLREAPTEQYRISVTQRSLTNLDKKIGPELDMTDIKEKRTFSELSLVAEIARYLNLSPVRVAQLLRNSEEGITAILESVNEFNELLYEWVIPHLFNELYELKSFEYKEPLEIELVKPPKDGFYRIKARLDRVANYQASYYEAYKHKSFHLSDYCFDSLPEFEFFKELLRDSRVNKVWFTGMLTHGQSDFCIPYIDPESHSLRTYYPDFLVQLTDGSYVMFEVKADYQIDDAIVQAKKKWANEMADASAMKYEMIPATQAKYGWSIGEGNSTVFNANQRLNSTL
ncbi:TnsA endonuclease N-terminal domain-containing protein [Larkinella arboricola]|nr:TnsA endonuclease N-terminal domain-containing protein [Larkinella arboricola]